MLDTVKGNKRFLLSSSFKMAFYYFIRPFTIHWLLARHLRQRFILRNNNHNTLFLKVVSKFNNFSLMHAFDWASNTF
jgi:hypothetical protein